MRRLLFCSYAHNAWGGIELWLHRIAKDLVEHGWSVLVGLARGATHNDPSVLRGSLENVETIEIDGRAGTPYGRRAALRRVIRRTRPDIVVPIGLGDVFPAAAEQKQSGPLRLVVCPRATSPEVVAEIRSFDPIIDYVAGVNPLLEMFLRLTSSIPPERITTVINGVSHPVRQLTRTYRGSDPLRIVFVGRFHSVHKRIHDAIKLIEELHCRGVVFRFSFVGEGEEGDLLRQRLEWFVNAGIVQFLGYHRPGQIRQTILPEHDVLVLFSPSEGCPQTVQQAMADGAVPMCSEFLGVHSLGFLKHGKTCLLFPVGAINKAADLFEHLAMNPRTLQRLSTQCQIVAKGFTVDQENLAWRAVFEKVMTLPPRGEEAEMHIPKTAPTGRLERLVRSPAIADTLRWLLRRRPRFSDGWQEWPGTISVLEQSERTQILQRLASLDEACVCDENRKG